MKPSVSVRRRWIFVLSWALGTAAAYALSGLVFHFPSAFPPSNGDDVNLSGFLGAAINGLATGLLVGGVQYFLLRIVGGASWRWIAASAVALWLAHTMGDVLSDGVALTLVAITGGLSLGALQWWAFRWPRLQGIVWLAATEVAWVVGIWLGYLASSGAADWRAQHVAVGITAGLALGFTTAAVWLWQLSVRHEPKIAVVR